MKGPTNDGRPVNVCARCGERLENYEACAAWNLDGSETVIHSDIRVCEYNIRTNPDVMIPNVSLRLVGVREDEPRMTGALDLERGWYR